MKKLISILLALALLASCTAAFAEDEWFDYHCEEENFTTKKPMHALTEYKNQKGYVGITFYLDIPGAPPYVLVHRRPAEAKFNNPENYLNNTYREFLEDKYANSRVGTNPAKTWEIGGKQLIGAKYYIGETVQLQLIEIRDLGDVEYTAMYDPAYEEAAMKALEAAVKSYKEDEAPKAESEPQGGAIDLTADEYAWMNEDWMDDEWKKECIAYWAEEREAAKAFTAGFSGKLTDEDLLTFVMPFADDYRIVLGKTTPADLAADGWIVSMEEAGVFSLYDKEKDPTGVMLYTEHGGTDEPVITMDAMFEELMQVAYCGFDGAVGIYAEDPDEYWYPDETGMKLASLLSDTGERLDLWDGMVNWLVTDYGAQQSEEGIYEAMIPLSDGRTLSVSSHDSQARISLAGSAPAAAAGTGTAAAKPSYLTPSAFYSNYNSMIDMVAEVYADSLGEDGVRILKEQYKITQVDPVGTLVYYGSPEWNIEAGFSYPEGTEPTDDTPAQVMNFVIKAGTPDTAMDIVTYILRMILAYEYQDDAVTQGLTDWFRTVKGPDDPFELPGYRLNAFFTEDYTQYAVTPTDPAYQEEILDKLEQQEPGTAEGADSSLADIRCEEDGFTTKIPAGSSTEYRDVKGQVGLTVYLGETGSLPCIIIHRRPMDGKFNNPENYLNNVYREFLENKYEPNGGSVGTNPAKTREVGGKQLIGARYIIKLGDVENNQLQLIEIRDGGDVEYSGFYRNEEEEKLVMDALDAAVANYAEE